ncbi:hypothetical protein X975_11748, partial [Stegodyphus mimosarum]
MYLEETDETLSAPFKIPRLRKDAVPTKLPGATSYLPTDKTLTMSLHPQVINSVTVSELQELSFSCACNAFNIEKFPQLSSRDRGENY